MHVDTTVVIPTYNESGNVPELVRQLRLAFAGRSAEVLFVDDSDDDTPEVIQRVVEQTSMPLPVRAIHRKKSERVGGLSGAVTRGIREAAGDYVVVMDADLQHPPSLAPHLRDTVFVEDIDVAVASRYSGEGDASGLSSSWRRTVSSTSTRLARTFFPRRVGAKCTDPMTGFFCLRRSSVNLDLLRPRGFKILLEILASQDVRVRELPFVFGARLSGESKASWRNGAQFVYQLLSLRSTPAMRFAAVGALGFILNLLVMAGLLAVDLNYVVASIIATEVAILHNFLMQERFVFAPHLRHGTPRHSWLHRAWRSVAYNNLDNAIRVPLLVVLVERAGMHSILAQGLTLVVSFGARFFYTSRVVYQPHREAPVLPVLVEVSAVEAA